MSVSTEQRLLDEICTLGYFIHIMRNENWANSFEIIPGKGLTLHFPNGHSSFVNEKVWKRYQAAKAKLIASGGAWPVDPEQVRGLRW